MAGLPAERGGAAAAGAAALAAAQAAIRLDPKNANAHIGLGIVLKNVKEDYAGAEEA